VLIDEGNEEYKVEAILDSHMFQRKLRYLVYWKGYGYKEHLWVNEADVETLEAIAEFYCINPGIPWNIRAVYKNHLLLHQPHRNTQP
jgi:hypothetical protein